MRRNVAWWPPLVWGIVLGIVLALMSEYANAQMRAPAAALWPQGYYQYLESKTEFATFSKLSAAGTVGTHNYAGSTMIWINGQPWMIPVYYPTQWDIELLAPWYNRVNSACQFEPWNCR